MFRMATSIIEANVRGRSAEAGRPYAFRSSTEVRLPPARRCCRMDELRLPDLRAALIADSEEVHLRVDAQQKSVKHRFAVRTNERYRCHRPPSKGKPVVPISATESRFLDAVSL